MGVLPRLEAGSSRRLIVRRRAVVKIDKDPKISSGRLLTDRNDSAEVPSAQLNHPGVLSSSPLTGKPAAILDAFCLVEFRGARFSLGEEMHVDSVVRANPTTLPRVAAKARAVASVRSLWNFKATGLHDFRLLRLFERLREPSWRRPAHSMAVSQVRHAAPLALQRLPSPSAPDLRKEVRRPTPGRKGLASPGCPAACRPLNNVSVRSWWPVDAATGRERSLVVLGASR